MAIKSVELVSGCISRAADDEPVFVLRAQDMLSPTLVRQWAISAQSVGCPREKVQEAFALADAMEAWPGRKYPD